MPNKKEHLLWYAREAIEEQLHVSNKRAKEEARVVRPSDVKNNTTPGDENFLQESEGVFVTLWLKLPGGGEELRGCIGRHERCYKSLKKEVQELAVAAGFRDPRFEPLIKEELSYLRIEVSLLGPLEKVTDPVAQLNPAKYGLWVMSGDRQGTLLPEIEGIETVEQQLDIVKRKADIRPHEKVEMFRYTVVKVKEEK